MRDNSIADADSICKKSRMTVHSITTIACTSLCLCQVHVMTLRHVMPYVEPRPSALNMTLPVFAAERRRLLQISIDSCWYAAPADACASAHCKPVARRCRCRSTGQTTNTDSCIDAYNASSVSDRTRGVFRPIVRRCRT